jgi:hypothetical protein
MFMLLSGLSFYLCNAQLLHHFMIYILLTTLIISFGGIECLNVRFVYNRYHMVCRDVRMGIWRFDFIVMNSISFKTCIEGNYLRVHLFCRNSWSIMRPVLQRWNRSGFLTTGTSSISAVLVWYLISSVILLYN